VRSSLVLGAVLTLGCRSHSPAPATPDAGATPDIVTHVSTQAPAGEAVTVSGDVDGAALRARTRARLAADRSPVVVLQARGPGAALELGRRLCEAVVPQRPASAPILLKPNIGGFDWFKDPEKTGGDDGLRGRITDPEFVRGVVRCLKARGHDHVTIAEGWGATHKDWERLARASGYEAMAAAEGVPLVALDDDGVFDVAGAQPGKPLAVRGMEGTRVPTLLVPRALADALSGGLFISLPKMKAHRFGVVSMAVKGTQGTVMLSDASPAYRQKWRMHRELNPWLDARKKGQPEDRAAYVAAIETFAERIADVMEVEAPDVVLAEGAPAMGGEAEQLWPSAEAIAVGGTNPVLVDRVGAQLLGLWDNADLARELRGHATSPLLETAARRFRVDLADPPVTGDGAALLRARRPVHFVAMAPFAIHSDATAALSPAQIARIGAPAAPEKPAAPEAPAEKPAAHAAPLGDSTVVIDGRGDDAAWTRATAVRWDTDYAGSPTAIVTQARFLRSPRALYALWQLSGAGLHADRSRPTDVPRPKLYDEDCVELFLAPDPSQPRRYYETEIGPYGHFLDVRVDLAAHVSDTSWSSGARIATTQDPAAHTAVIEAEITAPAIVEALAPGARLPLALYRTEGVAPRSYLAWSPPRTPKPNFHVPEAFGVLVVDP
jgi:uncharacterized protein (DUF362 family)